MSASPVLGANQVASSKPKVIGVYGVSGCGKSHLIKQLKDNLGAEEYSFFDGSDVINQIVTGGLAAFKMMDDMNKAKVREDAIEHIKNQCLVTKTVSIVAGHYMFWEDPTKEKEIVMTKKDQQIYSHIIYLDEPVSVIAERRGKDKQDSKRSDRSELLPIHLEEWKQAEKTALRTLCRKDDILFIALRSCKSYTLLSKVMNIVTDFQQHSEVVNSRRVKERVLEIRQGDGNEVETILILDGDKTLVREDTGEMFWEKFNAKLEDNDLTLTCPLTELFSEMGYSYTAFRQAVLMYEEMDLDGAFDQICADVADEVRMISEFVSMLQRVGEHRHVRTIIVTAGLRSIWQRIVAREGLSEVVEVIGAGRISDGFVVNGEVKAAIVSQLQQQNLETFAMGDSTLDLEMLRLADRGIVVVGGGRSESKSMKEALREAINKDSIKVEQALLPDATFHLLDPTKLPAVDLKGQELICNILAVRKRNSGAQSHSFAGPPSIRVIDTTKEPAAKVLATTTRDNSISGPALRESHLKIGHYLAVQELTKIIDLETYSIPHVQDTPTLGYRLLHEKQTLIVALMRGGEPMAFGINDAFPLAMFLHAKSPEDVTEYLKGVITVVLVDSVINTGKSIVKFVKHIRNKHATIRIVVVAGVAQRDSVKQGGLIAQNLTREEAIGLTIVTLRISDNKYTGVGSIDTGNRLFNTTHLE
jgi:uracil phosphoribosyltransferase/phosphoserine phosphatase/adenylylsulfate kinase-like enzyme